MTIPAWGWLVLRRVAGKRLPQHSEKRKVGRLSVQKRALSVAWSFGFEIGQDPGRVAASEAGNGKFRVNCMGGLWYHNGSAAASRPRGRLGAFVP